MAEVFKNAELKVESTISTLYTCPANTTAMILQCQVTNVADDEVDAIVDLFWTNASNNDEKSFLLSNAPIPFGGALNDICNKLVLEAGDSLKAVASHDEEIEITASILELS